MKTSATAVTCIACILCAACSDVTETVTDEETVPDTETASESFALGDPTNRFVHDAAQLRTAEQREAFVEFSFDYPASWTVESAGPIGSDQVFVGEAEAPNDTRLIRVGGFARGDANDNPFPATSLVPEIAALVQFSAERDQAAGVIADYQKFTTYRTVSSGFGIYGYGADYRLTESPGQALAYTRVLQTNVIVIPVGSTRGVEIEFMTAPELSGIETIEELQNEDAYRLLIDTFEIEGVALRDLLGVEPLPPFVAE
ncbi:MAG: hypothetical protein AAFW97_11300 [Pseudomonadota bacterium]